jgi:hypothetical protein
MFLLLQVPAVILNVVKDPEEPHSTQPLEPFNPHLLLLLLPLLLLLLLLLPLLLLLLLLFYPAKTTSSRPKGLTVLS